MLACKVTGHKPHFDKRQEPVGDGISGTGVVAEIGGYLTTYTAIQE